MRERTGADRRRRTGPRHLLLGGYGLFVLAAGARSAVQLGAHASRAPLAYTLSAVAAVVYAVGFGLVYAAGAARPRATTVALAWCAVELAGVLAVGTASVAAPGAFPDDTVWSRYGSGYGYVPLVLPMLAAWWLVSAARGRTRTPAAGPPETASARSTGPTVPGARGGSA